MNLDFKQLRQSNFFKMGRMRINVLTIEPSIHYACMYDAQPIYSPNDINYVNAELLPPDGSKKVPMMHISTALQLEYGRMDRDKTWLPFGFKEEIERQWKEVYLIIDGVLRKHNSNPLNERLGINRAKLLLSAPGQDVFTHVHQCKQSLVVGYKFDSDDNIYNGEKSHFKMGGSYRLEDLFEENDYVEKIYFPDVEKFYFSFKDDPSHEVFSNEWRFWWFTDFNTYFDVPELQFTHWNDPLLDNNKLQEYKRSIGR
jgi:hypothetical protein